MTGCGFTWRSQTGVHPCGFPAGHTVPHREAYHSPSFVAVGAEASVRAMGWETWSERRDPWLTEPARATPRADDPWQPPIARIAEWIADRIGARR
ncbi:hypothetical protein SEA_KOZIE_8 [Microbacterium phage Kozie]|uniref:Uncharacterized protein n=1 Tax=Microbacterium phage Kozie TaxID=2885981 RepID=A0AAE9C3R6_9CAUD|nr:hypothetical protein QC998_gp08 [Microbacterium phage Kozie]UDL16204.1 hypothetical protein SEA_KOZIE_8 [Microbacterium phage Kozie]